MHMKNSNGESLRILIKKEKERLSSLEDKRTLIDEKIRKSKDTINKYTLMENSAKYSSFTGMLESTGLAFDEILLAIQSGDLLSLQEKLEAKTDTISENKKLKENPESSSGEESTTQ